MAKEKFGRITICQAQPFVRIDKSGLIAPLPAPNLEWEKDLLTDTIKEAIKRSENKIELEFSGCSMTDISHVLGHGQNSILHISAHGGVHPRYGPYACFESEQGNGIEDLVWGDEISKIFETHKKSVKVVFLSMCDSEEIGRRICASGVPHVLCCKKSISDKAVIEFARNLYHGLTCGNSLLESFNAARQVKSKTFRKSELDKIILLPDQNQKGGDYEIHHTVDIFFEDTSNKRPKLDTDALKLPCEPPDIFWGRQEEMYKALKIRDTRLVQITGPPGIGKSSLAKAACKHIYGRPRQFLIKPIFWIDNKLNGNQYNGTNYSDFSQLFHVLDKDSSEEDLVDYCNIVSKALDKQRALLVIDARNLDSDAIRKLEKVVANIFDQTKDVKVMTICPPSKVLVLERVLNYENIALPPLNLKRSAKLFTRIILKTRASELEVPAGWGVMLPDIDPQEKTEFMSARSQTIYSMIGEGVPVDIHKKAREITKNEFQELITIEDKTEASRPINTRHHLELEILKIEEDRNTCKAEGQLLKAADLDGLLQELKNFREKLPFLSDLEVTYNGFYERDQYAEAAEIKARMKKERDANREMVVAENTAGDEKDKEIFRLKKIIQDLRNSRRDPSHPNLSEKKDPDEGSENESVSSSSKFSFVISNGTSIVDFKFESSKKFAIVCATNETCHPLCGGVNMAVDTVGGDELEKDISNIAGVKTNYGTARCSTGDAVIIGSDFKKYGKLHAPYVIFAVGPTYDNKENDGEKLRNDFKLRGTYQASLERAKEKKLEAVGFSLISAGNRSGGDLKRTLRIAVEEISDFEGYKELKQITICAFTEVEYENLKDIVEELDVAVDLV